MKSCTRCGAQLETVLACSKCNALLDTNQALDPFSVLGLEPSWNIDLKDLQRRLVRSSRLVHPDFFANEAPAIRELAGAHSARLNDAYAQLVDPARRADWLVRSGCGPAADQDRSMPQAFLLQVLEWNESLESLRALPAAQRSQPARTLQTELGQQHSAILQRLGQLLEPLPSPGHANFMQARRELNSLAYVERALAELEALRLSSPIPR